MMNAPSTQLLTNDVLVPTSPRSNIAINNKQHSSYFKFLHVPSNDSDQMRQALAGNDSKPQFQNMGTQMSQAKYSVRSVSNASLKSKDNGSPQRKANVSQFENYNLMP